MSGTENNMSVLVTQTALTAAFIGLCRALEHQRIVTPRAIAQEIFLQRNMLEDHPENRDVRKVIETIAKMLEEPANPRLS
ncbi:MAG: hypothetical protein ABI604_19355 [Nitrospirota bacterium]